MDWITGEKFVGIADFVYYPDGAKDANPLENTFCPCALKEHNIVYTHTLYVHKLFEEIKKFKSLTFTVITHNCDENVNNASILPDNVIKWYTTNVNVVHPRIESIPIGLENNKWFPYLGKKEKMEKKLTEKKVSRNLAYLNVNPNTNFDRQLLYDLFESESWVTVKRGVNGKDFDEYLDDIYTHRFVFCPEGNGIDTHRFWETLYMKSIPIVQKNINNSFYKNLPVLFVNKWEDVTENKLLALYPMFYMQYYDKELEMLTFEYWKNKILNGK